MIQKNVTVPFNYNLARKILYNEIPGGRILTRAGYPARITDLTYAINKMSVMLRQKAEQNITAYSTMTA